MTFPGAHRNIPGPGSIRRKRILWQHLWLRLLLAAAVTGAGACLADDTRPLIFGVFPYLPAAQLEKLYAPVAADLSSATGHEVQLRTRPSFSQFREELERQHYDLIFIQPIAYAQVASRNGYRAIARPEQALKAVFVARTDSEIQNLDDLRGSTLALPPRQAAVTVLARQTLAAQGLIPGTDLRLTYQNNHAACLRTVLIRKASACVTAPPPLQIFSQRTGVQFRTLAYSEPIPGSTYAVHDRLPPELRSAIAERIVSWRNTETGKTLLRSLKFSAFVDSSDEDYRGVRDILASERNSAGGDLSDVAQ